MNPTTNFELWFSTNKPVDQVELYALYRAVMDEDTYDRWEILKRDQTILVRGIDGWVAITCAQEKSRFIKILYNLKGDPSLSFEDWHTSG